VQLLPNDRITNRDSVKETEVLEEGPAEHSVQELRVEPRR
jgi:hypothetical protein